MASMLDTARALYADLQEDPRVLYYTPLGRETVSLEDPGASYPWNVVTVVNDGNVTMSDITVTLDRPIQAGAQVEVTYATADDTANAMADYTPASGTMVFDNGTGSYTITIPITNDQVVEPDGETFRFNNRDTPGGWDVSDFFDETVLDSHIGLDRLVSEAVENTAALDDEVEVLFCRASLKEGTPSAKAREDGDF